MTMRCSYLLLPVLAALVVAAACGSEKSESGRTGPTTLTIYRSDEANIATDCGAVVAEKWMPPAPGDDIPSAAMREVLRGVLPSSRLHRPGTGPLLEYFRGVRVDGGTAILMFDGGALEYLNNAACAQMAVKAPLERTLVGLPGISRVEYEIDGSIFRDWDA
jgi:hypothetical protein